MIGVRVDSTVGMRQYATNPYFVAVLGEEMAAVNSELLRNSNRVVGMMNLLTPKHVMVNIGNGEGLVRLVGIADSTYINVNERFTEIGRARGVRYNLPGGSQ